MKAILPGGSGFIGKLLSQHLRKAGWEVVILTRRPAASSAAGIREVAWDGRTVSAWAQELEGSDLLVNLSGRSVNCRYTPANCREIYASRLDSTHALGEAIAACDRPPPVWINSSSATIYRHAEDRSMDEGTGEIGSGFSVDVCQRWEKALADANTPKTRKVALRAAIVLGPGEGGVFHVLRHLVSLGLGGRMGPGTQYFSWLHHEDFAAIIEWIRTHPELDGAINASSPQPETNADFMRALRQAMRQPIGLPAERWMLKIGAVFLRTETELILKSRRVVPTRLLNSGYAFRFPRVRQAMEHILKEYA